MIQLLVLYIRLWATHCVVARYSLHRAILRYFLRQELLAKSRELKGKLLFTLEDNIQTSQQTLFNFAKENLVTNEDLFIDRSQVYYIEQIKQCRNEVKGLLELAVENLEKQQNLAISLRSDYILINPSGSSLYLPLKEIIFKRLQWKQKARNLKVVIHNIKSLAQKSFVSQQSS